MNRFVVNKLSCFWAVWGDPYRPNVFVWCHMSKCHKMPWSLLFVILHASYEASMGSNFAPKCILAWSHRKADNLEQKSDRKLKYKWSWSLKLLFPCRYMDPGNWATNIAGGASFGYTLLIVILLSSLVAMFLQYMAMKLGIVAERDLAQACRDAYPKKVITLSWDTTIVSSSHFALSSILQYTEKDWNCSKAS